MTEEIIIDGVDVAGCSLYLKDNGKCLRLLTDDELETECNAICDYGCLYHKEQLKRLEQENKELKEFCVELERQKQKQHMQWFKRCTEINIETSQYRSALEEIRENLVKLKTNDEDDFTYEYSKIEDKINEVLNDDGN